jgi:hypothetical protein
MQSYNARVGVRQNQDRLSPSCRLRASAIKRALSLFALVSPALFNLFRLLLIEPRQAITGATFRAKQFV